MAKLKLRNATKRLQTSSAALERSKAKLRSIREEAETVRRRLDARIGELEAVNADINQLLECSNVAALCIDRDYRIRRFSPAAGVMLNLVATDIGRSIKDITALRSDESLFSDVRTVLKKRVPVETELNCGQDCWSLRRAWPHHAVADGINGVAITLTDVSKLHSRADHELSAHEVLAHSLEQRVKQRTEQLHTLMVELALLEERERHAIATELHDGLGPLLAIVNMKLAGLSDHREDTVYHAALNYVRELVAQADRATRSLIFQISPPVLSELGIVPALEWLGEEMHRLYGIVVKVHNDGRPVPLDPAARSVLFRCVRELLVNVAKHAQVKAAEVEIYRSGDKLSVSVTDTGVGFERSALENHTSKRTFGLVSVRERIGFMGGTVDIDSAPGDGTVAIITMPLVGGTVELRKSPA